jgi:hypothetical protein
MAPSQLIKQLSDAGCRLRADRDQLRVQDPERRLTNDLRQALREHKAELLRLLRAEADNDTPMPCPVCGCSRSLGCSHVMREKARAKRKGEPLVASHPAEDHLMWARPDHIARAARATLGDPESPSDRTQASSLTFSPEAMDALEQFECGGHVFLTGRAGTGKSTLLDHFRQTTAKNIAVLAPTGVAAVNVRGQTIHSFCSFGIDITPEKARRRVRNPELIQSLDAIVIDEISMVRADLLDCVDQFLRTNGPDEYAAFGGIQMIFVGDPYQLAPVVRDEDAELFRTRYVSPFFFDSDVLKTTPYTVIQLQEVYRQDDVEFVAALDAIRAGDFRDEHLALLNSRVNPHASPGDNTVALVTTNNMATRINDAQLRRVSGPSHVFEGVASGQFNERQFPTDQTLTLKVGARVMLLVNDSEKRWINGTLATVRRIDDSGVAVELETGDVETVNPHTWENIVYSLDDQKRIQTETVGSFRQLPLKLAWATTIHKGQGQ